MVEKRPGSSIWYTDFTYKGRRYRRSTGTTDRTTAERFEAELKASLYREIVFGEQPDHTFGELCKAFLDTRPSLTDLSRLQVLLPKIGEQTPLSSLTAAECDRVLRTLQAERNLSNSTRNRYSFLLMSMLNKHAHRRLQWLPAPVSIPKLTEHAFRSSDDWGDDDEIDGEIRWITKPQAAALIAAAPDYWKNAIRLALNTGLRQRNVMRLQWRQVDFGQRTILVPKGLFKTRRRLVVPLNGAAVAALREQWGKNKQYVFPHPTSTTYPHIYPDYRIWQNCLKAAGIDTAFRWHDLRHTWASWMAMAGCQPAELMELGGWSSLKMVERYTHLSRAHLHATVNRLHEVIETSDDTKDVTGVRRL